MAHKICILIFISLGIQVSQAFASYPLEKFFGTYQVVEPRTCDPEDFWCRNLRTVYIGLSSSDQQKAVIVEYGPKSQQPQTTLLVEIQCIDLGNCPEFADSEGSFPMAGWTYMKEIPSTSFERHDYQSFKEIRNLQACDDLVTYDFVSRVSKGIDYSTNSIKRTYTLKKLAE